MPAFDDRKREHRDQLFGVDAGPKAEQGPAKMAGSGQGDTNGQKGEASLDQLATPQGAWREEASKQISQRADPKPTTSHADFIKSVEKTYRQQKEQGKETKLEQTEIDTQKHKY